MSYTVEYDEPLVRQGIEIPTKLHL